MELDDFKKSWQKEANPIITRESLHEKINSLEKSGRKIRRAFITELAIVGFIFLFFVVTIFLFNGAIRSFMYKLFAITIIGFLPTAHRLYQSQQWINSIDYSGDIRSNLLAFLKYYKTTLMWYWRSSMIICALIFIMLFTDKDFLALGIEWKIGTCAYGVLILILARPYLRQAFGKHVQEFENFLE